MPVNEKEREHRLGDIFAIEISDKGLLAKIYKKLLKFDNTKKLTQLKMRKRAKQIPQ